MSKTEDHKFSDYFHSYAYMSPLRTAFIEKTGATIKGFPSDFLAKEKRPDGSPRFIAVTPDNYLDLYRVLQEECAFRGIEIPACYVHEEPGKTGVSRPGLYSIFIHRKACERMTPRELRALVAHEVKHLYQGQPENRAQYCQAEFDADWAAVTSTDYPTVRSMFTKAAITVLSDDKIFPAFLKNGIEKAITWFPEYVFRQVDDADSRHPRTSLRLKAMKEYGETPSLQTG